MRTGAVWDGDKLQDYIVRHASNAGIEGRGNLAQASGINRSSFSKWYNETEQPSVESLQRLAPVIRAPLSELLVLAGRMSEDVLPDGPPIAPAPSLHPLARELNAMLADDSPLPDHAKDELGRFVDTILDKHRRLMKGRRRAG